MASTPKSTPILLILVAGLLGYIAWSGAVLDFMGIDGIRARQEQVVAMQDTLAELRAKVDTAKRDLAVESIDDVKARTESYRASLAILRTLVPDEREVANLIDDVNRRARVRGLHVAAFDPIAPVFGPEPFDTHQYNFSVIGRYNQVGAFLTDIASLRRIIVPERVQIARSTGQASRILGDTLGVIEAKFSVRTYVKAGEREVTDAGL